MSEGIKEIRTSEGDWLKKLAEAYKNNINVIFIDDAGLKVDPRTQTLLAMGMAAALLPNQWAGVLVSLGVAGAGVYMIVSAILDPEPTSKLGLLIVGGSVVLLGGGLTAIKILTGEKPPTITVNGNKFELKWD